MELGALGSKEMKVCREKDLKLETSGLGAAATVDVSDAAAEGSSPSSAGAKKKIGAKPRSSSAAASPPDDGSAL